MADDGPQIETPNSRPAHKTEIARATDVLPASIHLLPNAVRPFFPGQVMPMIMSLKDWAPTLRAVHKSGHGVIGVVYVNSETAESAGWEEFYSVGTVCRVHQVHQQDDNLHVVLVGEQRFRIEDWVSSKRPFMARVRYFSETEYPDVTEIKAYVTAILNTIKELLPLNPLYGEELKLFMQSFQPGNPGRIADFAASMTTADAAELQQVLEAIHIRPRLEKALMLLKREVEVAGAQMEIRQHVEKEMQSRQREVFLREQLKFIQKELGISKDDKTAELERLRERIDELEVPEPAQVRIDEELQKFSVLEIGSPEYAVTRNYLDWLTSLPWNRHTPDQLDMVRAASILDRDHEGLPDVKQRILEFLGVAKMRGEVAGSILLFVGPPGVGKTSLGRSIAAALGRKFYRFSLGGMRDEAEIKGHRRTYIGAMPGKFIQALKEVQAANPVIMLDEVDKVGASFRGDPASALLEVLDPDENTAFLDHYLDVPFDLSKALFICTANQLDTIPAPLLDRMELIRLSGYLADEKLLIAKRHLFPRSLRRAGLKRGRVRVEDAAFRKIIQEYSREAGVRQLEKVIGRIIRKSVMKLIDAPKARIKVRARDVEAYLGKPLYTKDTRLRGVGVVTGLAWTPLGGATLSVEATKIHGFSRGFKLTGQLGEVMRESAEIAYSYVVSQAPKFDAKSEFFKRAFVHLHVPAGATPKDGPSAGVTMASALLSLARNRRVRPSLAMTGELTLTGHVLAVGGLKEKVIAAKRAGIKDIAVPAANQPDFDELPESVRAGIRVHFVSRFADIVGLLFD
ncbi:MAG: endopeptidase La [Gammaproteobacteria bacterium]|nr:endopeptidase La [Gammaproteobacteria bacterium]